MAILLNDTLCADLCKALGFDPITTRKLVMTMEEDHLVIVDAETFAMKEGIRDVTDIVKSRCRVVPIDQPDLSTFADESKVFGKVE